MVLTRRIIPCLDLKDGRVVKGTNFLGLRDAGDPVELAERYNEQGADEVVFLDITASKEKRGIIIELIKRAADQLFLPLTVGGGLRSLDDIQQILRAGADKVSINTSAVHDPRSSRGEQKHSAPSASLSPWTCAGILLRTKRQSRCILEDGRKCWYEVVIYGGQQTDRYRCRCLGKGSRGAGRRRDPPHQHGDRRHEERV